MLNRTLGDAQHKVLEALHRLASMHPEGWVSPTAIARELGSSWGSAWTSPKLKALVRRGLVERHPKGLYRPKGEPPEPPALDAFVAGALTERKRVMEILNRIYQSHPFNPWSRVVKRVKEELEKDDDGEL